MIGDSGVDLSGNNINTLSNALSGLQTSFPMVAPGLSGPRWTPPSTADRQINMPNAKKELANKQLWRVDEWKEHGQFSRALMRYLRTTDASLLQFLTFWNSTKPPDSNVYLSLYQTHPELAGALNEYRMRNKAILDFVQDLLTYQSDTVTGRDIEKFQEASDGLGLIRYLENISSPLRAGRQDILRNDWSKVTWQLEGSPIEVSDAILRLSQKWELIEGNSIAHDPSAFYRELFATEAQTYPDTPLAEFLRPFRSQYAAQNCVLKIPLDEMLQALRNSMDSGIWGSASSSTVLSTLRQTRKKSGFDPTASKCDKCPLYLCKGNPCVVYEMYMGKLDLAKPRDAGKNDEAKQKRVA